MCPKSRTSVFVRLNLLTCVISSEALTVKTNFRRSVCRTHACTAAVVGHE